MKTVRTGGGLGAPTRPYFKQAEIERTCVDELRQAGFLPGALGPVRIDRFVETRFKVSIEYDDLPSGVLGFTRFSDKGVDAIVVSRALADAGDRTSERRLSSTIAHEGGHGLLHAALFVLGDARPLFEGAIDDRNRVLCRDEAVTGVRHGYDGRWWEHQANLMMASLLIPEPLAITCLKDLVRERGQLGRRVLEDVDRQTAARRLAETFEVSLTLATYRADALYPPEGAQLTL